MSGWVSFITGGMTVLIAYALFSNNEEEEFEMVQEDPGGNEFFVNSSTGRYVTLSCQTCRKLKKHQEIGSNLYQCTKCKRHVDLRRH